MAAVASDAAGMSGRLLARLKSLAEGRAQQRREAIAEATTGLGVDAFVEGEAVRLSGRGLLRRWLSDLALREAGRGRI